MFNITLDVDVEGEITIVKDFSYVKKAPPGRYIITGHHVAVGEYGQRWVSLTIPTGLTTNAAYPVQ